MQKKIQFGLTSRDWASWCQTDFNPMDPNNKLNNNNVISMPNPTYFRSLIDKLLYLTHTRPNIMFMSEYFIKLILLLTNRYIVKITYQNTSLDHTHICISFLFQEQLQSHFDMFYSSRLRILQ